MKKNYIQPSSKTILMSFAHSVCVGSVHGNSNLQYSGAGDPNSAIQRPL